MQKANQYHISADKRSSVNSGLRASVYFILPAVICSPKPSGLWLPGIQGALAAPTLKPASLAQGLLLKWVVVAGLVASRISIIDGERGDAPPGGAAAVVQTRRAGVRGVDGAHGPKARNAMGWRSRQQVGDYPSAGGAADRV